VPPWIVPWVAGSASQASTASWDCASFMRNADPGIERGQHRSLRSRSLCYDLDGMPQRKEILS
jgi:hypothetical protein